jgi:ATP-dependent DNA ligase|tara:strand:- start:3811 stop:4581 length:771 start_codon:yes stop_codon:yes gene_type:complete
MLCNSIKDLSKIDESKYIYEIKKDGTRVWLYCLHNKIVRAENRRGTDILYKYPELKCLKISLNSGVLDGELCCKDFSALMSREHLKDQFKINLGSKINPATFYAFDILDFNGKIMGNMPLLERKEYLNKLHKYTLFTDNFRILQTYYDLDLILKIMKETNAEGIILKEKNSLYVNERSSSWLKFKKHIERNVSFNSYEENPDNSITLTNGFNRVKCCDPRAKQLVELNGRVLCEITGLEITEKGHIRMPVLKRIIQ